MEHVVYDQNDIDRFKKRLVQDPFSDCIFFNGFCNPKGYGQVGIKGKTRYAHRLAAEIHLNRRLTTDELVMHSCDLPACCNPEHLSIGTIKLNNQDKAAKGRVRQGKRTRAVAHLTFDEVIKIKLLLQHKVGPYKISVAVNRGLTTIKDIACGKTWKNVCLDPDLFERIPLLEILTTKGEVMRAP